MRIKHMLAVGLASTAFAASAEAATIISAVDATSTSDAAADWDILKAIDQSGLSTGYLSGITNFEGYLAGDPTHTPDARFNEWFTAYGVNAASATFDLGGRWTIDRIAVWGEEYSGFQTVDIWGSLDGVTFFQIVMNYAPVDNPVGEAYSAEVISLGGRFGVRYVRLDMSGCPQPDGPEPGSDSDPYIGCSMGEIAFASVPLPASGLLLMTGLVGLGGYRRFGKRA